MRSPLIFPVVILPWWLLQKMECDCKQITQYPYMELKLQPNQNLKVHDTLEDAIKFNEISFEHQMEARSHGLSPIQAYLSLLLK